MGSHARFYHWVSRTFGFSVNRAAIDQDFDSTSYDVVLSNGTIINGVTKTNNPDLYFALNGAASSFAIITTYYFQARHVPTNAVIFSYSYYQPETSEAAEVFAQFQDYGNLTAPANLGLQLTIGENTLVVSGVWYGPESEFGG